MNRLITRFVVNAAALWAAIHLLSYICEPCRDNPVDIGTLLWVALIFGLVNALIKPIVKLVTCPFYILTLGLFTFVVNAGMLMFTSWIANSMGLNFQVGEFWQALVGGIIISIVSTLLSVFVSDDDGKRRRKRD